jgi:putative tricarboxylic transport membrane protein
VANFMLLVLNLPLIGLWVRLLTIPRPWLYGGILVFATLGTIGADASTYMLGPVPISFGLVLLLLFGILGYLLRRFGYPIAPVVVGLILGPMAEKSLRQALQIAQGDPSVLFHSWIAIVLWLLALTAVFLPIYLRWRGKGKVLSQFGTDED